MRLVQSGAAPTVACQAAGLDRRSLTNWRHHAREHPGGPVDEWLHQLDSNWALIAARGESTFWRTGSGTPKPVACPECNAEYHELICHACNAEVALECQDADCGAALCLPGKPDVQALAKYMAANWSQKWGHRVNVDTNTQLRAAMAAIAEEFSGEPEIFRRIVDVLTRGQHVGEMTG